MGRHGKKLDVDYEVLLRNPETRRVGLESEVDMSVPRDAEGICEDYETCKDSSKCDGRGKMKGRRNKFRQTCHSYIPPKID